MGKVDQHIDERASERLDGDLSGAEREDFERELARDPALAREVKRFEEVVGALRALPAADAPPDFLRKVQHKIRRRSRGRYFGRRELSRYRFPYEAVINAILLGLLMAVYIIAMPPAEDTPVPVAPALTQRAAVPSAVRTVLEGFGAVTLVPADADGEGEGGVVFQVALPAARVAALKAELGRFAEVTVGEPEGAPAATTQTLRVRVRVAE